MKGISMLTDRYRNSRKCESVLLAPIFTRTASKSLIVCKIEMGY